MSRFIEIDISWNYNISFSNSGENTTLASDLMFVLRGLDSSLYINNALNVRKHNKRRTETKIRYPTPLSLDWCVSRERKLCDFQFFLYEFNITNFLSNKFSKDKKEIIMFHRFSNNTGHSPISYLLAEVWTMAILQFIFTTCLRAQYTYPVPVPGS